MFLFVDQFISIRTTLSFGEGRGEAKELLSQVRQIEIKTKGLVNQVFSGEYHSVFKGRGMEFSEVREYQFGDDGPSPSLPEGKGGT